ncbi:MAG: DegT/DnrJ/EryC1/StrS family aminotransferase [Planctomycetota bacterium]
MTVTVRNSVNELLNEVKSLIQVFKPSMGDEEINAVAEVIRSGWIGLGPRTAQFEKQFAEYLGAPYVVAVNSCTAALDLALRLLGIGSGDEVIVPTMTFVSTAHCVAYNDALPVFADIDERTLAIDIEDVKRKISPRTKAVIPVHYGGRPVDIDALRKAVGPDIFIIEDAAHAAGALYRGKRCGTLGDIACFSFHAVKNLAMGDGGAVVTRDKSLAERAKRLRWLGIDRGTWDRTEVDRSYWWEYYVNEIGLKCHLNDIAAAIGLVQLKKLDAMNARRREIAERYTKAFGKTPWIETPPRDDEAYRSSWHIYCIKVPNRDELSVYLKDHGVATGVHYKPIHLYRCYEKCFRSPTREVPSLPTAERVFQSILTLPMYPDLTDAEVDGVIDTVCAFYTEKPACATASSRTSTRI